MGVSLLHVTFDLYHAPPLAWQSQVEDPGGISVEGLSVIVWRSPLTIVWWNGVVGGFISGNVCRLLVGVQSKVH